MKKYKVELEIHVPEEKLAELTELGRQYCGLAYDDEGHRFQPKEDIEDEQDALIELIEVNPFFEKLEIEVESSIISDITDA